MTIRDVAKRAQVSVGTVSRVLNSRPDVKPELRTRVERAMRDLGYRPNVRAQNFARNSSAVISFVLSNRDLLHPFHSRILQGVSAQCEETGFFVLYSRWQYSGDTAPGKLQLPSVLKAHGIADCLILAGTNYPNLLEALDEMGTEYVLLANNFVSSRKRLPVDQVRFDDTRGAFEAVRYLISLGHKDIWYIGDVSQPWYNNRYQGYLQAMAEAGLQPRGSTAGLTDNRFANGMQCTESILGHDQPVSAIFAGTDDVAYGAWEALNRRGLRVPADVSLIGFDNQRGPYKSLELTTIRVEAEEIGRQLARMAIAKIREQGKTLPEVIAPVVLIKRATCQLCARNLMEAAR